MTTGWSELEIMGKKELIFVYSPGRCGTAYLAQVFGHEAWSKNMIAMPQPDTLVMHEAATISYRSLSVMRETNPKGNTSLTIQGIYVRNLLKTKYKDVKKVMITSNLIGRFCSPFIINVHQNYKCIYIERNINFLISSWVRRLRNREQVYGKKNVEDHLKKVWSYTKYTPLDKYTIIKMDKKEWFNLHINHKLRWYCSEVKARWNQLKQEMEPNKYIETSYEKIITEDGLDEISNFINLPYSKELMKVRVNQSEKY